MKLIIDRFEGDIAVCETDDGGHVDIARELLPDGILEGVAIEEAGGRYVVLTEETEARRRRLRNMLKSLIKE